MERAGERKEGESEAVRARRDERERGRTPMRARSRHLRYAATSSGEVSGRRASALSCSAGARGQQDKGREEDDELKLRTSLSCTRIRVSRRYVSRARKVCMDPMR